ncbi:MAG: hypothetical protein K6G88_08065 [Lachnospiraceae bacterium]|nr:hypothetical protein [Lachnospiraceae bacterium]
MSKINAFRFINLNYNNDTIKIDDETFFMNAESTFLSLRNGGGKSVLVQMMLAPFVHKRYRDTKDRLFESYFKTSKPTFILVEWILEQGAGYVLTGMMVRKNQDVGDDKSNNLDIINIVSEYREPCVVDIHNLPVVEKGKKEIILKNYASCKQLFEEYKKDSDFQFSYYDMNNSSQQKQYFEKIKEYQIDYKEWESIIKKINLQESGLSNLFEDCKDERGLVEKWFLETVEEKLNKDKNRIKEFESITEKYIEQYRDNQSKIQRRDTINIFKEQAEIIEEKGKVYLEKGEEKANKESEIGSFINILEKLQQSTEIKKEETFERIGEINEKIDFVDYEKLSIEYYSLNDEQKFHLSNRDMIEFEKDDLERDKNSRENKLHILLCAKQRDAVYREEQEVEEIKQQLEVSKLQNKELIPERNSIGHRLYEYYNSKYAKNKEKMADNDKNIENILVEIQSAKNSIVDCDNHIRTISEEIGYIQGNINNYSKSEDRFNKGYGNILIRNILGYYEPGFLEIKKKEYNKEYEENKREYVRVLTEIENLKEQIHRLERTRDDYEKEENKLEMEKQKAVELNEKYNIELSERSSIIKYLNMDDNDLFDFDKIMLVSGRKLKEIENYRKNLEREIEALKKELDNLINGKVIEIPEKIEEEFQKLGLNIVYGMEWIKKNGYSEEKNKKLIKSNPMLPYSVIMSNQEVEKLKQSTGEVYTSFPIPIVVREQLDHIEDREHNNVIDLGNIKFYVLFNEQLLDENSLADSIEYTKRIIDKRMDDLQVRECEYNEYYQRQEKIRNQQVTKSLYENNQKQIEILAEQLSEASEMKVVTLQKINNCKDSRDDADKKRQELDKNINILQQRNSDFENICDAYGEYVEFCENLEMKKRELGKREEQKKLTEGRIEKMQVEEKELHMKANALLNDERELEDSIRKYSEYTEIVGDDKLAKNANVSEIKEEVSSSHNEQISKMSIIELEARYNAITQGMTKEIHSLESKMQKQLELYDIAKKELERQMNKYSCDYLQIKNVVFTVEEENNLEILIEDLNRKIDVKKELINNENIELRLLDNNINECVKKIEKKCCKNEPLDKSEIKDKDFDKVKKELIYEREQLQSELDNLEKRWQSFDTNLTSLSEFNYLKVENNTLDNIDFLSMSRKELSDWRGILLRDYRECEEKMRKAKDNLVSILNQIVRMEEFEEEFYRKPIETMIELSDDAAMVLQQLKTTIQSYDSLMEKIEVDISIIEKEKEKIVELMEDYVNEVHINLGRIDGNSTIKIRERSVKMLKINLPEWNENQNLYRVKLVDFIDDITARSMGLFDKNQNPHEFIGTKITTKNLYDMIIGINNVEIKLYKIEEQREYPITWAEVAKNSGGEGFLSAFVILSSLLYFMRKDETDLFAERNEGKVLIMDNPFAQTNAEHLLKPLMDIAKKANTQLICLSGLGGDTIYNRFDNIYVLNLIDSRLRTGKQYMKVEHKKGNTPDVIVPSHIEVVEQLSLF